MALANIHFHKDQSFNKILYLFYQKTGGLQESFPRLSRHGKKQSGVSQIPFKIVFGCEYASDMRPWRFR